MFFIVILYSVLCDVSLVAIDLIGQTILNVIAHNEQSTIDFVKKTVNDQIEQIDSIESGVFNLTGVASTKRRVSKDAHDMRRQTGDENQRPRRTRYYSDSSMCRVLEQNE